MLSTPLQTVQQHILEEQRRNHPQASGAFSWLLSGITLATKIISAQVRRAGLMEICYRQRILKPRTPALSVKQLEDGLELTVTELEGSLWYLKETDLIRVSDAGNFALSVKGINAIEGGFVKFAEGIFDMKGFGL
mgnify:CR=1 FL=1